MKQIRGLIFIVLITVTALYSCKKDQFLTDPTAKLFFSTDTVTFDTVFSGIGSAVRHFRVYNPHDLPVKISEIKLAKGNNSKYRLNINGTASDFLRDIEIAKNDSIFIFVDVNIDPEQDDLIEYDEVLFFVNGNQQHVSLTAFGQDVNLIDGKYIETEVWNNEKPYLIYNSAAINENEILTINSGVHIYFHKNSRLIVLGTLSVNGTIDEPVIFEGDRLNDHSSIFFENDSLDNYHNVAGQWGGIWLTKLSKNNYIEYAVIKNAVTGIQVDSVQNTNPQLTIYNSKIEHHSYAGIFAQQSDILAGNCVISDCGYYNIAVTRGGSYNFIHCTINNYWDGIRNSPAVYINNFYSHPDGNLYVYDLHDFFFGNSIIWGTNGTELVIEKAPSSAVEFQYKFESSILKIGTNSDLNFSDIDLFKNIYLNKDPLFSDPYNYIYSLSINSPAIDKASLDITNTFSPLLNNDIKNISRTSDLSPDIGAYEYH